MRSRLEMKSTISMSVDSLGGCFLSSWIQGSGFPRNGLRSESIGRCGGRCTVLYAELVGRARFC